MCISPSDAEATCGFASALTEVRGTLDRAIRDEEAGAHPLAAHRRNIAIDAARLLSNRATTAAELEAAREVVAQAVEAETLALLGALKRKAEA